MTWAWPAIPSIDPGRKAQCPVTWMSTADPRAITAPEAGEKRVTSPDAPLPGSQWILPTDRPAFWRSSLAAWRSVPSGKTGTATFANCMPACATTSFWLKFCTLPGAGVEIRDKRIAAGTNPSIEKRVRDMVPPPKADPAASLYTLGAVIPTGAVELEAAVRLSNHC